jgi:hypothetical protein
MPSARSPSLGARLSRGIALQFEFHKKAAEDLLKQHNALKEKAVNIFAKVVVVINRTAS